MSEKSNGKRPLHLWIVGVLSLLWNAMGAYDYLMTQTKNEAYMAKFTPEQLDFYYGFPMWVESAWAIAVWGAVVGSIFLLMAKRVTQWVLLVSLVAMVLTTVHNYGISNGLEIMGDPFSLTFTAVIFLASLALYLYARVMVMRGVLK